jgi:hypothetical protein
MYFFSVEKQEMKPEICAVNMAVMKNLVAVTGPQVGLGFC